MIATARVARFLNSRWMLLLAAMVTVTGALWLYAYSPVPGPAHDRGIALPSANLWLAGDGWLQPAVNLALTLGICLLMDALSRAYNLRRSTSALAPTFFLLMMLSTPSLLLNLTTGTVLSAVLLGCLFLLYSTYGQRWATHPVFLIFLILSAMTMTQYCYIAYMLVFAVGAIQMRAFTGRMFMAMILGLITPWWILAALSAVTTVTVQIPDLSMFLTEFRIEDNAQLLFSVGLSVLLLVVAWIGNFQVMIAFNAHKRAYNGTLTVLMLVTLLAAMADFSNLTVYTPVIFMLSAFQLERLLGARKARAGNIAIITVMVVYLIIYASYPLVTWLKIW